MNLFSSWHRLPEPGSARWRRFADDGSVQREAGDAYQAQPRTIRRPSVAQSHRPQAHPGDLTYHQFLPGKFLKDEGIGILSGCVR